VSKFFYLQICGPVKSWKRTQNPSNGKPVAFGFCEFESAEGILRATRLLNKLSIDGQELVVCIITYISYDCEIGGFDKYGNYNVSSFERNRT
jgi:hypothetical protein